MKKVYKIVLATLLVSLFTGCGTTTQNVSIPDINNIKKEEAIIQVHRESGFFGAGRTVDIYDFNKKIGELGNGGTLVWSKPQGRTCLGTKQTTFVESSFDVKCFIAEGGKIIKLKFNYIDAKFILESNNSEKNNSN